MKGIRSLAILLASLIVSAPALAQPGSAYYLNQRGMNETFRLDVGGFFEKFDTTLRVGDAQGSPGTNVSLESTLGAPASQTSVFADGTLRLGRNASLQFAYRHASRSSSRATSTDIQFGDQTYRAGGQIATSVRLDVGELYYAYSLVNNGDLEFALMLGVSVFSNKVSLDASGPAGVPGGTTGGAVQSDSRNLLAPVPAVGASFRYALYPKFFAWGRVKGLKATISGRHGSMLSWGAGLDLFFTQNIGIGGGYEYVKLVFEKEDARQFGLDYKYNGPMAYVSIAF
jgi:opacity protein-like surface antigen